MLIFDCKIVGTDRKSALKILTHFLLPTYSFIFRERCRWTVSVFGVSLYQRRIFTYPFPTSHLFIYILWTVSV